MDRQATIKRISKETEIELTLKLDGTRNYTIDTGVGFLDHMLELLAFHGELDLNILCKGDLKVDTHHSIEDIGIVLGQALKQALGDKKGIVRYATTYLPMDESLSRTSLDLCGRFYHIFKANFKGQSIGEFPLEMLEHFFHSLRAASLSKLAVGSSAKIMAGFTIEALAKATSCFSPPERLLTFCCSKCLILQSSAVF